MKWTVVVVLGLASGLLEGALDQAEQLKKLQCSGSSLSVYTRQTLLEIHNGFRKQMAHGQQPNKCGLLSGGKNIYKLDYNCTLEDQMYANIDCEKSTQGVTSVGGASPFSDEQAIKMMVNTYMGNWYTIVRIGRNETSVPKSWYQMAFGIISQMGCAMKMCPPTNTSSFYTVKYGCFYDVVPNGPAYEAGPVCKQDSDCTGRTHSKCLADEGLCHYSEDYPFESGPNEICPPGTGSPRIDDPARIAAVEVHNAYRSSLIHGKEPMGPDGALAPRGGNMYKMVWNWNIEKKAQEWCSQITHLNHSSSSFRNYDNMYHGENLAGIFGAVPTAKANILRASKMWWDELQKFGWTAVENRTLNDLSIAHWSQWRGQRPTSLAVASRRMASSAANTGQAAITRHRESSTQRDLPARPTPTARATLAIHAACLTDSVFTPKAFSALRSLLRHTAWRC